MSATVLQFGKLATSTKPARRWEPRVLFGAYSPPAGSRVVVAPYASDDGSTVFDVEVIEHEGQDGFAVLASCSDRDDAEHIAEAIRAEIRRSSEA